MRKFPTKASNKEVAIILVLEHLQAAAIPVLTMDQAFALVTEATKSQHRRMVRDDRISIDQRKYRRDFFPNNFLGHKQIAISLTHNGDYIFYLKETARHPVNRKVISLFERGSNAGLLPDLLPRRAAIGR
ncbi:hypothetical protein HGA34_05535 [Candidatus Falkowbacteria bacterium]|nr:hypothetical protein [Candidatus Falkowbacteria bacterium]